MFMFVSCCEQQSLGLCQLVLTTEPAVYALHSCIQYSYAMSKDSNFNDN